MEVVEYMKYMKVHNAHIREWEDNGPRLFSLILQHCTPIFVIKIEGQPGYKACKDARDPVKLLLMLCDITHKHNATTHETMAIVESDMEFYLGHQGKTDSINEYYQLFKSRVDTITA